MATKITNDNIVNVDASKLTGSINANMLTGSLPAGMADLTPLQNDLAVLALHQAIAENKSAYSLQNTWIEQFEDDSGITDEVDADRNVAGEYMSSISETVGTGAYVTGNRSGTLVATSTLNDSGNGVVANLIDGVNSDNNSNGWLPYDNQAVAGKYIRFDWGADTANHKVCTEAKLYQAGAVNPHGDWKWQASNDAITWTDIGSSFTLGGASVNTLTELSGNTNAYRYYQVLGVSGVINGAPGNTNSRMTEWEFKEATMTSTTSATGSFTSVAITPQDGANKSSLGLVLLYKDSQGTNALNTDISAQVSADNGVTYSDCVLAAKGTFSAGIKTAIAPAVDVTSGNQLKYKINFANQSPGVGGEPGDYGNSYSTGDRSSIITATTDVSFTGDISNMHNGVKTSFSNYFSGSSQSIASKYMRWQFNEARVVTEARWWNDEGDDGAFGTWKWQGSNDGSNWTDIGADFELNNLQLVGSAPSYQELTSLSGNTTAYTYYQMLGVSGTVSFHSNHLEIEFKCNAVPGTGGKVAQVYGASLQY